MTAQFGPHRWSAGDFDSAHTDAYRGASFDVVDLTSARFVDCDLSHVTVVDSWLVDVSVSGFVRHFLVNDVDVSDFVEAELDRRHPERVQLRETGSAGDFRLMWATLERLWGDATARADQLPEPARSERVDGEWSFAQTLRHMVFIVDSWASRTVLDEPTPFHRLGLPQTAYPVADAAALGIEVDAKPSFDEVIAAYADRVAVVRGIVGTLSDSGLGRSCDRSPAPGYPEEPRTVGDCLGVVMDEACEHYRFAVRDLSTLEARQTWSDWSAAPPATSAAGEP